MYFEIIGEIGNIETIAVGKTIRDIGRLRKQYGAGRWRKLKGVSIVRLFDGRIKKAEIHWYEAHGIGKRKIKIKRFLDWGVMKTRQGQGKKFAVCITDTEPDLELRKIYQVLPDEAAEREHYLRIIDESGEDYLYPASYFVLIELPKEAERALLMAS